MLYALIPVALMTLAAISLALLFHKNFADMLAPVVFSVILLLYGFYIWDKLFLGRTVILLMYLVLYISTGVYLLRRKEQKLRLIEIVTTPAFFSYLAALVVFLIFSANKFVSLMDSLRLWGAYPRALHATGMLQLGEDALVHPAWQSYPPGMPLLCYFFTSFSLDFSESTLFFTYSFFGLSLMLPFLRDIDKENKNAALLGFLAIIFVPYFITGMNTDQGYYYSSLYIDIPLGICCGYFFCRAFHSETKLDSICAVLSCGALVLLKDSGTFIAICGIAGSLVWNLLRKEKYTIFKTLLYLIVLAFAYGSWKYLLELYSINNHLKTTLRIPALSTLKQIAMYFLRTPVSGIFTITGAIHVSLPAALLMIFTAKLLAARQENDLKLAITDTITQMIAYAGFFVGYCITFLNDIEIGYFPSYVRYFCTIISCAVYILLYDFRFRYGTQLRELYEDVRSRLRNSLLAAIARPARMVLQTGIIIAMAFSTFLIIFNYPNKQISWYTQGVETAEIAAETLEEGSTIFLCFPATEDVDSHLHHRIYFELIDDGIFIKNLNTQTKITASGLAFTYDSYMDYLIDRDFDYVFLAGIDNELIDEFGVYLGDITLEDTNLIYKVDAANRKLIRIQ